MKKYLLILLVSLSLYAQTYQEWLKEQNTQYKTYKDNIDKEFKAYKKAQEEAFKEFSAALGKKWPKVNSKPEIGTKHKIVEYSKDLNSKKVIDYKKKELTFEVIAKSEKEAKKQIEKMFNSIMKEDVKTAYKNDILEQKINKKLHKKRKKVKSNQKLIADIIKKQERMKLAKKIKSAKLVKVKYKGHFIYKANVKLPPNSIQRKAKLLKPEVLKNAKKQNLPPELVYAIIHSESSFNPMAKSFVPAFGLMQIVPRTAGVDSYRYLYKKKKLLSSSYLYNPKNNITIGSAYLHILYFSYLRKIKNPQSKLYCTIAAYNTGAGNVAKAFIGSTSINKAAKKINSMSPDRVYKTLMRNLPYNETKHYLQKVSKRVSIYNKFLKEVR